MNQRLNAMCPLPAFTVPATASTLRYRVIDLGAVTPVVGRRDRGRCFARTVKRISCCATEKSGEKHDKRDSSQNQGERLPTSYAIGGLTDDTDNEESIPHPSWRIYEREGNQCVVCDGKGQSKCMQCYGDGVVYIGPDRQRDELICPQCGGAKLEQCARCLGTGVRPSTRIDLDTYEVVPNRTNWDVINDVPAPKPSGGPSRQSAISDENLESQISELISNSPPQPSSTESSQPRNSSSESVDQSAVPHSR